MQKKSVFISGIEIKLNILQRHLQVLNTVQKNEPVGMWRLSELTGYPEHRVRASLRMLEQAGLIKPSRSGAVTTDAVPAAIALLKTELKDVNKTIDKLIKTLE